MKKTELRKKLKAKRRRQAYEKEQNILHNQGEFRQFKSAHERRVINEIKKKDANAKNKKHHKEERKPGIFQSVYSIGREEENIRL